LARKMSKLAITVYGASSSNIKQEYFDAAIAVGRIAAQNGVAVVNGGGKMGLMGAVNQGAIEAGGETIGVIPQFMVERGWHHPSLTRLEITDSMHSRKELMAKLATGIIALPGGVGTLDELMEIICWRQLGLFSGNIVILNVDGYYDNLIAMLKTATDGGFMRPDHLQNLFTVTADPEVAVKLASTPVQPQTFSPKF
jgi:uncharacterized protein (TIGR00730 family)